MMNDDELEEAWQSFATPQAKLMREAEELAASGDPEILAARAAYVAAWRHYRSLDGRYEAVKAIKDVSWIEVHAVVMEQPAADIAAMYHVLAIVGRRRRVELQQQRQEGQGGT